MTDSFENSLTDLTSNIITGYLTQQNQIAQPDTMRLNLRNFMVSNDRALLSSLYVENGLIQTLVKQPIDDAYRDDIIISTKQLDTEQIEELLKYYNENCRDEYLNTRKWGRLFGGAGLIINTNQDPKEEFDINKIKKFTPIDFYSADRWELNFRPSGIINGGAFIRGEADSDLPYNYYGETLHKSRVLRVIGERAPSLLALQLMGWGMSEVERLVRSINSYVKNQDVIFELLDEAKIDVYKIENFNSSLANAGGTNAINKRIQLSNQIKNYLNALTMDMNDDYIQKTMSFSGLGDILTQIRQGVACDMRMPITKLFGVSSAGFNSGEDDLENYNSMIESDIRGKDKPNIITLLEICSMKLFGFVPDDLNVLFKPLRMLTAEQEQTVKNAEFERIIRAKESGLIDEEQSKEAIDSKNLLPIKVS